MSKFEMFGAFRPCAPLRLTLDGFADGFTPPARPSSEVVTRALDIVVALLALILFAPVMLLITLAITSRSRGPVLFMQHRVGRNGVPFACWKFRSMLQNADALLRDHLRVDPRARAEWDRDHKLRDDPRVTRFGQFLRKSSLDELPQLFNVLRGDMSIVGPRPIVTAEIVRYGRFYRHYCSVRPGITGLWQVNGRNNVSYRRRVAYDVVYSRIRSPMVNIRILAATLPSVLAANGSY